MNKKKLIIGFIALTFICGCVKNKIPKQFQDDRNPKPAMYERTQI
jgi:hypothetical protein|tara:strand:- start:812 stop:946 length:135 start_codon:yes stop_codon:yes gene_type:complete